MASINFSKIISGISNTVGIVNKAIPIYKQVTPIVKNVKSAFNTVNSIKDAEKEAAIKEAKSMERPISNFKNKKSNSSLDTLTFFQ